MDSRELIGSDDIMQGWYRYAAKQAGSVESALRLLRERLHQNPAEQQQELGATDEQFVRLRGMRLPRTERFGSDAQQIALVCGLANPLAFVRMMLLARGLLLDMDDLARPASASAPAIDTRSAVRPLHPGPLADDYYMAAFDEQADLDSPQGDQLSEEGHTGVLDPPASEPNRHTEG